MSQELFTRDETADILHITKWNVYRLVQEKKLKNVRFNARTQFFDREEIERYARDNGYRITIPDRSQEVSV
ncbi:hypothetical protein DSECCO2_408900 [anaerobic digester metagenome]